LREAAPVLSSTFALRRRDYNTVWDTIINALVRDTGAYDDEIGRVVDCHRSRSDVGLLRHEQRRGVIRTPEQSSADQPFELQ